MTEPQTPQPPPEPMHVMTHAQYKRFTAIYYTALAITSQAQAEQEQREVAPRVGRHIEGKI